jgi:hypothetical protein
MIARPGRAQLFIRHGRRDHDPSIAGLRTGKAPRYFASDFDSFRMCDATEIAVVEAVAGNALHHGTARAGRYSNAVLDRGRIDEGEIREEGRDCFNQLK